MDALEGAGVAAIGRTRIAVIAAHRAGRVATGSVGRPTSAARYLLGTRHVRAASGDAPCIVARNVYAPRGARVDTAAPIGRGIRARSPRIAAAACQNRETGGQKLNERRRNGILTGHGRAKGGLAEASVGGINRGHLLGALTAQLGEQFATTE